MNAPHRRPSAPKGFTLVELLVSVGLTAILMWGILQLYTSATRFSATMYTETELVSSGRAVLERICSELASAATLDVGYLQIARDGSLGDTLQFVAPVGPDGRMANVCYQVRQDTDGTLMLYRAIRVPVEYENTGVVKVPTPPQSASATNGFDCSPLGVKVDALTIRYIDYDSTSGTPQDPPPPSPPDERQVKLWRDGNANDPSVPPLPRAILLELRLADGKGVISMVLSSGAFLGGSGI